MASLSSSVPRVSVRLIIITRERRGSKGASAAKAAADASARAVYQQSIRARITTLFSIASCLFYYLLTRLPWRHYCTQRAAGGREGPFYHTHIHIDINFIHTKSNQLKTFTPSRRASDLFRRLVRDARAPPPPAGPAGSVVGRSPRLARLLLRAVPRGRALAREHRLIDRELEALPHPPVRVHLARCGS